MEISKIIFGLVGGLALFLYGLMLLSSGMQKMAGERLKRALETVVGRPIRGVITGGAITAVVQSSSVTTVTILGLINAGLLTLEQAVGVIMGANIGTTVTAQIVAFPIGHYALIIIGIGFLIMFLSRNNKPLRHVGEAILGLGILFLGMNIMKEGVKPLRSAPMFIDMLVSFGKTPVLGILAGAIFTGIVQSSSATSGLVIAMGTEGLISLKSAVPIILGANIGTCITALLASIGASLSAKRASIVHLIFNVIGVLIFLLVLPLFVPLVSLTSTSLPRQIANAHTLFNVIGTCIMLPFMFVLVVIAKKLIPGEEVRVERGVKYIDRRTLGTPSIALSQATKETVRMAEITQSMLSDSAKVFLENQAKLIPVVSKQEEAVDEIHRILREYLTILSEKTMSKEETQKLAGLLHAVTDIERVGDHINNTAEIAEKKNREKLDFSSLAMQDLGIMFAKVADTYAGAIQALRTWDKSITKEVFDKEAEIDELEKKFEENHMKRLDQGICSPRAGVIYVDLLRNLERIGDHSDNIAHTVLTGF